jgi:hypothetical protein
MIPPLAVFALRRKMGRGEAAQLGNVAREEIAHEGARANLTEQS